MIDRPRLFGVAAFLLVVGLLGGCEQRHDVSSSPEWREWVGRCYRLRHAASVLKLERTSDAYGGSRLVLELADTAEDENGFFNLKKNARLAFDGDAVVVVPESQNLIVRIDRVKSQWQFEQGTSIFLLGHIVGSANSNLVLLNNAFAREAGVGQVITNVAGDLIECPAEP